MTKIVYPVDFFSHVKQSLLLDTSVFIDAFRYPNEFGNLFNEFKNNEIELLTLKAVELEFLKGSKNELTFNKKKEFIGKVVDTFMPEKEGPFHRALEIAKVMNIESKDLSITDLLLGATLKSYSGNLSLLTKNIKDFPTNTYSLSTYFNLFHMRAIHVYGIYEWPSKD